ncbi:hypothetical protein D9757_007602 [Collybiopsis confluens]|uniref:Uncharacterized protein n=1 Tax=Collybiopsis confluens TaxID=2823264 RepID=A0A8H5HEK1_9AGAR|nr:hypothetical protein D9757_007602 [Collybiopsis confluens]
MNTFLKSINPTQHASLELARARGHDKYPYLNIVDSVDPLLMEGRAIINPNVETPEEVAESLPKHGGNPDFARGIAFQKIKELYASPYTGAVTTRTSTLSGYNETPACGVVFTNTSASSLNSYGYPIYYLPTSNGLETFSLQITDEAARPLQMNWKR